MSDNTQISWADSTWSPVTGCTRVSDGCLRCYIERTPPFRMAGRRFDSAEVGGTTGVQLHPERLTVPLKWRKPRRVFVCSLADLFHDDVPDEFIADVFAVMAAASWHTYQVLSKRHARMRSLLNSPDFAASVNRAYVTLPSDIPSVRGYRWPLPNVWLGVSAENQQWADIRIPALLETPAAVRWVSAEPLLGEIDLTRHLYPTPCPDGCGCRAPWHPDSRECACGGPCCTGENWPPKPSLSWVVAGGESGPGARACDPEWIRLIVDQCRDAGVAVHVKQLGSVWARANGGHSKGGDPSVWPEDLRVREYPDDGRASR